MGANPSTETLRWNPPVLQQRRASAAPGPCCYVFVGCQARRDRWARIHRMMAGQGAAYRIVYAGPAPAAPAHPNEIHLLGCRDTYEALPEKVVMACRYLATLPFEIFAKLDDDMVVSVAATPTRAADGDYSGTVLRTEGTRIWHQGKCTPGSPWNERRYEGAFVPWCEGGSGYLLSKRAVQIVSGIDTDGLGEVEIYEDLMVAKALRRYGIYPKPLGGAYFAPLGSDEAIALVG